MVDNEDVLARIISLMEEKNISQKELCATIGRISELFCLWYGVRPNQNPPFTLIGRGWISLLICIAFRANPQVR